MTDKRERVLDALDSLLREAGPVAATMDAVAARAGVSKGGLLYHFPSKEALYEGLLDRLRTLGQDEVAHSREAPGDAVRTYLASSSVAEDAHTRAILAALHLVGTPGIDVRGALAASFDEWGAVLAEAVSDPILARLVQLVGDGLYLRSLIEIPPAPEDADVTDLLQRMTGAGEP